MRQHKHPDGGSQPCVARSCRINFCRKHIQRNASVIGDCTERVPKRSLKRDAGAVAPKGQGMFHGSGGHVLCYPKASMGAKSFEGFFDLFQKFCGARCCYSIRTVGRMQKITNNPAFSMARSARRRTSQRTMSRPISRSTPATLNGTVGGNHLLQPAVLGSSSRASASCGAANQQKP